MSEASPLFDWVADQLAERSQMSRLAARGTLRLALKEAGHVPQMASRWSMVVVVSKILPALLTMRGVRDSAELCRTLAAATRRQGGLEEAESDSPEKVFSRLGGGRPGG